MNAQPNRLRRARGAVLIAFAALCFGPTGCAGTWDEVWSRDFSVKEWWTPPDPLVVLRDDSDGDHRARALRALREPKFNSGSDKDQDGIVQILVTAAATERAALCRLAAIETLQTFKDPRVVRGLEDAYYRATSFPPETATIIRCLALEGLGNTGQAAAIDHLVRVLREPPVAGDAGEDEKQQKTNERTAAARALGHFKGRAASEALVATLKTEQDVALRDRAHEALKASTGRNFGPDAKLWEEYLQNAGKDQPVGIVEEKGFGNKILDLVDFK